MRKVSENDRIWYRRTFDVPAKWHGKRLLLHFGAVDFETTVWVNSKQVGQHRGGYDGFTFDITDAINPLGENELVVAVWDPTDAGTQPRGKQVRKPNGIWYTSTSGIWQTVWLEPVNAAYITDLKITPDVDASAVTIAASSTPTPRRLHGRGDDSRGAQGGLYRLRKRRRTHYDADQERPALVAGGPAPLQPDGHPQAGQQRARQDRELFWHAQDQPRQGPEGVHPPDAEQQAVFPDWPAGPGVLARRHLHRAHGRGAAV